MTNPMVSIIMITYGHEKYIAEAIKGVFLQKTKLPVHLIIANDKSPDNSDEIIKKTLIQKPDNISVSYTCHQTNKGMMPNFFWALKQTQGKYIAMCEGDDYWTDPYKLQKQINALENHSGIDLCGHPSYLMRNDEIIDTKYGFWGTKEKVISQEEIINNYITCGLQSILFRKKWIDELINICQTPALGGHSAIHMLYGLSGGMYYLPDYMSVYRENSSSSVSKTLFKKDNGYVSRNLGNLIILDRVNDFYDKKYEKIFSKLKRKKVYQILDNYKVGLFRFLKIAMRYGLLYNVKELINYARKNYA